ncbi:MAG: non-canonical purine NTP pyrophosphatase [Treponema sp.]|nr:non-canonical purine NTP pyrophosphatase [Treponema sp.]
MTIWFASGNSHKKEELEAILNAGRPAGAEKITVLIPAEAGIPFDPDETGGDFLENALIKARALYRAIAEIGGAEKAAGITPGSAKNIPDGVKIIADGVRIIADDSGLCVDALGGRPGILSARYGCENGKKPEAREQNALLLGELGENPNRKARFVCAMVLLFSPVRFRAVQETLEGELIREQRGTGGFGYDPIFWLPEKNRTVAELSAEEKNTLSHRGRAGSAIAKLLSAAI